MADLRALRVEFKERFGTEPTFFRAPGRVNLIGEFTDYNDGFVMPAAIQFYTTVAVAPRTDRQLVVRSTNFGETRELPLPGPGARAARDAAGGTGATAAAIASGAGARAGGGAEWIDYVVGVAVALEEHGITLPGADLLIHGEVPLGAGLSSSAALEVATALALSSTVGQALTPVTLALLGQRAENQYVGMRCGIMDQFAAAFGRAGHAIKIDCRSLEHEYLPLVGPKSALAGTAVQLVICNTMVRHQHAGGEYNRRRQECERGLEALKRFEPSLLALRDVSPALLREHECDLDPVIYRRCRHVVSENSRVGAAADALKDADLEQFGKLMRASHQSLRDDFEVSCEELDVMVRHAELIDGVLGSRMTGGGFGGCTVNLVRAEAVGAFRTLMSARYLKATGITPDIYVCEAADGAGPVELESEGAAMRATGRTARLLDLQGEAHRRFNPLRDEWVLVSPHRNSRPWQGQTEPAIVQPSVAYDPQCYLCPGNARAGGAANPKYTSTFVFDNDFPALLPQVAAGEQEIGGLLRSRSESGSCRVICYSPIHNLSLGQMTPAAIRQVIDAWSGEYQRLGAKSRVNAVTIFENRGAMMGASNPHPHGQIWANETVPDELAKESAGQLRHLGERGTCLLCDYATVESELGERMVCGNGRFVAVVPFWAVWPFEVLVLPRAHVTGLDVLDGRGRDAMGEMLKELTGRYDRLFGVPFPYTMGVHQRPTDGAEHPEWHMHVHFYPPLLRSASVRKFMVGYEMLAGAQRDITAEVAAGMLRG